MAARREARGGTLILGGGFAGAYVARLLGRAGATMVSRENFMLYTPILPEAASGTLEPRHVVVPLRVMCRHAELLLGRATGLDEEARTAQVETDAGPFTIGWTRLVLALGAVPRTFPVPGLEEHALAFKDLADAIHLRNHVLRELEGAAAEVDPAKRDRHLTFVFVGAGYAVSRASPSCATSSTTRSATTPCSATLGSAGCSSTPRTRFSRRSRPGSGGTRPSSSPDAGSRSAPARPSSASKRRP